MVIVLEKYGVLLELREKKRLIQDINVMFRIK
jgi:hypothetical protein